MTESVTGSCSSPVFAYTPLEFRDTLHLLAEGKVDATAMVTGTVGLHDAPSTFEALRTPQDQAKVLIDPSLGRPRHRPSTRCTAGTRERRSGG